MKIHGIYRNWFGVVVISLIYFWGVFDYDHESSGIGVVNLCLLLLF